MIVGYCVFFYLLNIFIGPKILAKLCCYFNWRRKAQEGIIFHLKLKTLEKYRYRDQIFTERWWDNFWLTYQGNNILEKAWFKYGFEYLGWIFLEISLNTFTIVDYLNWWLFSEYSYLPSSPPQYLILYLGPTASL